MVHVTARAVTGVDGRRLVSGWDFSDMRPEIPGERIDIWDREVSFKGEVVLSDILNGRKFPAFHLLASILVRDEKIAKNRDVGVYASGSIKELRVGKRAFRSQGTTYYGKKP